MDTCVVWVKFSSGLSGLHGSKKLLHGSIFYAGHKFSSVAWVEVNLHVGQKFLGWSVFFLRVSKFFWLVRFSFAWGKVFCVGQLSFCVVFFFLCVVFCSVGQLL